MCYSFRGLSPLKERKNAMKELLKALRNFGENPDATGDNLFSFFASITAMDWQNVVAAGLAIRALGDESWAEALKVERAGGVKALDNPIHRRIKICLSPVVARVSQLITEAPKDQQAALLISVKYGRQTGFMGWEEVENLQKTLGLQTD